MKKIIVALSAAALMLASCSGDYCKCTTKSDDGANKQTYTVAKPEDGKCSDLNNNGKTEVAGVSIDTNTSTKCVTVSEED